MSLIDVLQEELYDTLIRRIDEFSIERIMQNVLVITNFQTEQTAMVHLYNDLVKVSRPTSVREHVDPQRVHRFHLAKQDFPENMVTVLLALLQ